MQTELTVQHRTPTCLADIQKRGIMLVFDVNWNSVEDLYVARGSLPSRLLFQLAERRQARQLGWVNGVEFVGSAERESVYRVRRGMPAGWFLTLGFLSMPAIARWAKSLSRVHLGSGTIDIAAFVSPHYVPLQRALNPGLTIYHPIDNYVSYWPRRAALTIRREAQMVAAADVIICAGAYNAACHRRTYPDREKDIHHIPNPVPEQFLVPEASLSPYFSGRRSRPVIGYVGPINERFEQSALFQLVEALPDVEIRLRSGNVPRAAEYSRYPNIRIDPQVSRDAVPAVIQEFDVCILPQTRTEFNLCASPRKLYEYLGSSRPIVALNAPEADTLRPHVISTHSASEFVDAVARIVKEGDDSSGPHHRREKALQLTPAKLAAKYAGIIGR